MKAFLLRWFSTTVGVAAAAHLTGMQYESVGSLAFVALLLGVINALVRPLVLLLSLPFILFTLGSFVLVVNALLFWMVANLVPGFHVDGFWQAFFGAFIVSVVSGVLGGFFKSGEGSVRMSVHRTNSLGAAPYVAGEEANGPGNRPIKQVSGRVVE